jgi:hypothetical protein
MKNLLTLLILIAVSVSAVAQKKRMKINRHLTTDVEEVQIPDFKVKDHNGHSLKFEKPRVYKFKNGTAVKWGNKTRGHNGRHKLIDETIDSTAEPIVIPPVEQEPQPLSIPAPEQAVVGLEALSAGGGNPTVLCVVDYDLYLGLGSNVQNCISYVLEGMASIQSSIDAVAGLKAVGYTMIIKEIIVNSSPSLYSQLPSNTSMMKIYNEFGVDYCDRWDIDGKILFTRRANAGSIASSGFGSRVWNLAVIGGSLYWLGTPNYNGKYALGHEAVGHWLTAPHAFECQDWPDGSYKRIDSTYSSTGPNCSRTTKRPTAPTTLMGYAVYGTLDPECKFHFVSAAKMVTYWNSYRMNIPLGTAPTCTFTTGPWSEWSGGYRSRSVTATPSNCRGIAPRSLERQPSSPPCTYSLTLGPCINGFQTITPTAINSPCTGNYTGPTSQVCTVPITNTFGIAGTPYTGYTRADTAKAVDGNETTRFLTTGATTLTWTFSQPTTRTQVYLSSGFNGGSPNQTLTLTVDGVNVDLAFDKKVKFTKAINATGKRFVLTTTGTGNISRIFEVSLK